MTTLNDVIISVIDTPNKNNRIYTKEAFTEAINRQDKKGVLYGQMGMPSDQIGVDLTKLSHRVTNIRLEEQGDGLTYAIGTIEILNTPEGDKLEELIVGEKNALSLAFRTAGTGFVDSNGVVSDFNIVSINAVTDGA